MKKSIPGFVIKSAPRETRIGARLAAARVQNASDSETSQVLSARSESKVTTNASTVDDIEQSWLAAERQQEARRLALEEKEKSLHSRKLALKLSKYKIELYEANKLVSSLVETALNALQGPDLILLGTNGLANSGDNHVHPLQPTESASSADAPYSEDGFLGNVRQLTSATIKLTLRKKLLEDTVISLRKEFANEKKQFDCRLHDMQSQMEELRAAKENAEFALKDKRLVYEQQIKNLEREMEETRAKIKVLELVNNTLKTTVHEQEGELLEVPRLEESYLRSARGIVLQKEKKIVAQTIELKKIEKEIELTALWRNKARALEEETQAKDRRIADLKRQLAQVTHKNIALENGRKTGVISKSKERFKEETSHQLSELREENPQSVENVEQTGWFDTETRAPKSQHSPQARKKCESEENADHMLTSYLPLDVENARLKTEIMSLKRKLHRCNMAMSQSRAYPLLNLGNDPTTIDDPEHMETGKKNEQETLNELFDSDEDKADLLDMDEEQRDREEQVQRDLAVCRIERAINVSTAYKAKLEQLRASRPGVQHLKNLRNFHD